LIASNPITRQIATTTTAAETLDRRLALAGWRRLGTL
jgi:hypothetical protein